MPKTAPALVVFAACLMAASSLGAAVAFTPGLSPLSARPTSLGLASDYGSGTGSTTVDSTLPGSSATALGSAAVQSAAPPVTSPLVERAIAAAKAAGPNGRLMSFPHAPATAAQIARSRAQGYITPLDPIAPAPMGIADYGLRNGTSGQVVPYILNTTELVGNFTTEAAGLLAPSYTYFTSPGGFSVQQNAVLTNVSIFGNRTFEFWTQDTIYYNEILGEGTLVSDTWNWTTNVSTMPTNSILAHGPGSVMTSSDVYFTVGQAFPLTYPFSITFTSESEINATHGGEEELAYSALITRGATTLYNFPDWDYVVFNSTGGGAGPAVQPSNFTANGEYYTPVKIPYDFELVAGGPGGGSQVDLFNADAFFTLQYLNSTTHTLESVPSAFNYGGETGETLTGGSVSWDPFTPTGQIAVMTTGPSILTGLWNSTAPSGQEAVTISVTPANAFVFVAPTATSSFLESFELWNLPEWSPLIDTTTIYLPPGFSYELYAGLSNYAATSTGTGVLSGAFGWSPTLTRDDGAGIYTPLWAWSNSQLTSIASGGAGTAANPYILVNDQTAPIDFLDGVFGIFNDWTYPVYSGVFLMGTTDYVEILDAAPLTVDVPFTHLPSTNSMPYWFYDVSHVSIVDSYLPAAWYLAYLEVAYLIDDAETPAAISFWNSSDNLVADNLIDYTVQGMFLFGGSANTIWGNSFVAVPPPASLGAAAMTPYNGITVDENGDLIYNNAFLNPYGYSDPFYAPSTAPLILAQEYEFNVFDDAVAVNNATWNITPQAASVVHYAFGFPSVPLVGSIVSSSWQGGNFWADYGNVYNPVGVLPYASSGYIGLGGDYAPLPAGALVGNAFPLEFTESGLLAGTVWSVVVNGWVIPSFTGEISFFLTNGSYQYLVPAVPGYTPAPSSGSPLISGVARTIPIQFTSTSGTLSGTVTPASASVEVNGVAAPVTGGAFSVSVPAGVASINASAPGFSTYSTNVSIMGGATTTVTIHLASSSSGTGWLAGSITPASASLTIDGQAETVTGGSFNVSLSSGIHVVEVTAAGYVPYVTTVDISTGATQKLTVALAAVSPASTYLSPLAYALIAVLAVLAAVFLVMALMRGRKSPPPAQAWSSPPGNPPPPGYPPGPGS